MHNEFEMRGAVNKLKTCTVLLMKFTIPYGSKTENFK